MTELYQTPLGTRYASREMLEIFGADRKFRTWRRLWIALAKAEHTLGLPVTEAQIAELEAFQNDINYDRAAHWEKKLRHDVMAHIHAYGEQCPGAMPILHLGATSCYVGDNTDLILLRDALRLTAARVADVLGRLAVQAERHKALPCLGFTHFQPAQLVTVGKRITLWMNDLLMDLQELSYRLDKLLLLGSKGTTGTQASFLELFGGDHEKVLKLDRLIAEAFDFPGTVPVSGQTYSRKQDAAILATLGGVAQSAAKFATDFRLLSHLKEMEEPFETAQVGSSAMPYKRNPMRSERICSLARVVTAMGGVAAETASNQWFERTLDDSAGRRFSLPEAFLALDAILLLYANIAGGMTLHPRVMERHIREELPFMATENILMDAVRGGGDRQALHERIRLHSNAAGAVVKDEGGENDLCARIAADPAFGLSLEQLEERLRPELYIGRCPEQVDAFLRDHIRPALAAYGGKQEAEEPRV